MKLGSGIPTASDYFGYLMRRLRNILHFRKIKCLYFYYNIFYDERKFFGKGTILKIGE